MSESEIIAVGRRLARQLGGVFAVNPRMLADFRAYRSTDTALTENRKGAE